MPQWKNACVGDLKRLAAIQILLKNYPYLTDRIFCQTEPCLRASPKELRRGLSSGERILVGLAIDFWNSDAEVKVCDLDALDDSSFENVITALKLLRTR